MLVGVQHALGVGGHLQGVEAALPGGLDPEDGLRGQALLVLAHKDGGVVLVGGEGHHLPELLHGGGLAAPHDPAAQLALTEKLDLLQQQPLLDVHELFNRDVQETAILAPDLFLTVFSYLFLKSHRGLRGARPVSTARRRLAGVGSRKGVFD